MAKPIPVPDEVTKPFWDACDQDKLVMQQCTNCNRFQFPPEKTCSQCGSEANLQFKQVSGKGTIYSYIVMHDVRIRVLQPLQPFNIVSVKLDDAPDVVMLTQLPGTDVDKVPVGAKVEVEFEEVAPGRKIPQFHVVS